MKNMLTGAVALILLTIACSPVEQNARDTAAALNGALTAAQFKYQDACIAEPKLNQCQIINRAVDGQNALVTAVEAYCGWSVTQPIDKTAKCIPVQSAQAGLQAALGNANLFITELKGLIQ